MTRVLQPKDRPSMRGDPSEVAEIPHPRTFSASLPFVEFAEWFACGPPPRAAQGWKLYVPLTIANASELIGKLVPFVARTSLHFKVHPDHQAFAQAERGDVRLHAGWEMLRRLPARGGWRVPDGDQEYSGKLSRSVPGSPLRTSLRR